jgi:multidrug efflux pump subunit AcrA (membrane-fusion protein)
MNNDPIQYSPDPAPDHAEKAAAPRRRHRYWLYGLIAAVVIAALLLLGWLPRYQRRKVVEARAVRERNALLVVQVVTAQEASKERDLTLPGTVVPVFTTHIYARATGYVRVLKVDIGSAVHRGQLLAVIEAPELDATVQQQLSLVQVSNASLNSTRSQLALQQATYDRVHVLAQHGVLSQQDDDVALAAVTAAAAAVQSAQSNMNAATAALAHWSVLASYEKVRSPIDGTVTARNVDVGSLVSTIGAGEGLTPTDTGPPSGGPITGGAQGGELFQVTDIHNLRIYINVPEGDAEFVETGQEATLTFSELPSEQFRGTIIRSSNSLNQETRTLLLEVRIVDPQHRLRPGMFASVQLHFKAPEPGILISGDSVLSRAQGEFVAVVQNNVVHLQPVHVGRDLGSQLYVTSGLKNGDQVIVNPTDSVQEGVHVQAEPAPKGQEK